LQGERKRKQLFSKKTQKVKRSFRPPPETMKREERKQEREAHFAKITESGDRCEGAG